MQGGIDRGWFRAPRSTKDGKPHLPSILAIASDIVSAMAYLHAVSDQCKFCYCITHKCHWTIFSWCTHVHSDAVSDNSNSC